jgi:hypothetical protein
MRIVIGIICCLSSLLSGSSYAQDQAATADSARDFVEQFYRWYVPVALSKHHGSSWDIALHGKKTSFSSELAQALKSDSDAQAKVKDDIVGLDFDPFLNTQDPCQRFELGKITQVKTAYRVEVFNICSGKKSAIPDVAPEVMWANGHWEFVNFYYPNQMKDFPKTANLLAMLKMLEEQRQKDSH